MPQHKARSDTVPVPALDGWTHERFLKADFFSRSDAGTFDVDGRQVEAVRRDIGYARWWTRPLAVLLANRERRALRRLVGVADTPDLLFESRRFIIRSWIAGEPMEVAQPRDPAWFSAARKLLVRLHRQKIAHNDLAKQQNWLITPDGRPALIDFQLASVKRRRSRWFLTLAREDLRHLLKHKRMYCPEALTASERRMLATPSLISRVWRRTWKPAYNFVTRKIFRWSDGEGQGEMGQRP